jgi:hypothetical protein
MTHDIVISLSEQAWVALQREAAIMGITPEQLASKMVEDCLSDLLISDDSTDKTA